MTPFRHPGLPDRQAIHDFFSAMQPRAGRIIGALSGMLLAGPAWLYGLCVGLLLGYMVDTVRTKTAAGSAESGAGTGGTDTSSSGAGTEAPSPVEVPEEDTGSYQQLGLEPGASMAEVKKAWRIRSRQAHPDAPGGAAEDFMTLKKAYEKIMEQKRPAVRKNEPDSTR